MLNKEICINCRNKEAAKRIGVCSWYTFDEGLWNEDKKVYCPPSIPYKEGLNLVNSIPKHCPYKLEHIMKRNET